MADMLVDGNEPSLTDSHDDGTGFVDLPKPPAPEVVYNWQDITNEFVNASADLKLGELLHDCSFGLFEAMSAIEMMDPKMDAGMLCNQSKHKVLNLQMALQSGKLKVSGFTQSELIGIMDETFACLVTWLEGHSLAQTVFINLFLHDPSVVEDKILKAFCVCFLKLIDIVRERINRASVFEEEDFQSLTYSFKMAGDVADARAMALVKEAEEDLNRTIKSTRVKAGEERNVTAETEHELCSAVHARLKFTRLLFATMLAFGKDKCQGLDEAQKSVKQMKELLDVMKKSEHLGLKLASTDGDTLDDSTHLTCFEPLVNQRLLPPTFPRYTRIKSRPETIAYLDSLNTRLGHVATIPQTAGLHQLLEFFLEFSKSSPCVLSRSLLQLSFIPQNRRVFGSHQFVDVLRDTIRAFTAPTFLISKGMLSNNVHVKENVEAFLVHAVRPITAVFQTTGHNRARQRDRWGHLLEDLSALQDEAEKVDAFVHTQMTKQDPNWHFHACLSTWVLYHTLHCMIRFTLSGFELELYSVREYHYVFWYLCEGLYNWLLSTLSRAENMVMEQEMIADQQKGRGAKKNKQKKKKSRPYAAEMTLLQGIHNMCGGYYKACIGLIMDGKLAQPTYDFDCEEVRYNHRFAPFGCIVTPPPMPYIQFREMTDVTRYDPPLQACDLYAGASKGFQQARMHLESITTPSDEAQTLLKIAKTNFIVTKVLMGGHKKDSKMPPEFDFSLHKVFPVIKLP